MPYSNGGNRPPRNPPYPGGAPGGGGSGGGSSPGSGAGAPNVYVNISNGGVFAMSKAALFPVINSLDGRCEFMAFDVGAVPDDQNNDSAYTFKVEDVQPFRQPTIRRVLISYLDLGKVTITVTISVTNDDQEVETFPKQVTLGNNPPTNRIMTQKVDIVATGMNQQLSITREAGAGPLSISKVLMVGEVEEVKL
jgi:hypothetical protein